MDHVTVWTDGSCHPNPGPGGWAAIIDVAGTLITLGGGMPHTTNNLMEMLAVASALEAITPGPKVIVRTDSQYVIKGVTEWTPGWIRRNWVTTDQSRVKNAGMWKRLDRAVKRHMDVQFIHVKGHQGTVLNERCDRLASAHRKEALRRDHLLRSGQAPALHESAV